MDGLPQPLDSDVTAWCQQTLKAPMLAHWYPDGHCAPLLQALPQMYGLVELPVAPQLPPRHSVPDVASPVAVQQAPVGLVPCTYWLAGTQAVVGLSGMQNALAPASSHEHVKPGSSPVHAVCAELSHSSSHILLPPPRSTQFLLRQSAAEVQQ